MMMIMMMIIIITIVVVEVVVVVNFNVFTLFENRNELLQVTKINLVDYCPHLLIIIKN